ncbi:hypothetical protein NY2A_b876R [Paramecium bursaria Chlorella virus NY2A]|uniref:Uncharacterized protein b876R n=1 Tax=Paramecium bursaria Chlorella virus NY2A TaxID=46021 RepID=A7IY51_PBCVN|nr:hypothetical protein NY2A_b876R [Paramecium bursaria Chlorella virus NY2A]ABT15275.1 hypothetical protein NY2A_b876R [Paramecium bursaria Chlorella virus NY2A]
MRSLKIVSFPDLAAKCIGTHSVSSMTSRVAPAFTSVFAHAWPLNTALWRGVHPEISMTSRFAPASIRVLTHSSCPF